MYYTHISLFLTAQAMNVITGTLDLLSPPDMMIILMKLLPLLPSLPFSLV